jgi:hypothetical protein
MSTGRMFGTVTDITVEDVARTVDGTMIGASYLVKIATQAGNDLPLVIPAHLLAEYQAMQGKRVEVTITVNPA